MLQSMRRYFANAVASLIALAAVAPSVAGPVGIGFELTSLAVPGRYEYRYTVTNVSLASPVAWFSVDFDSTLYEESSLLVTSTGLGNWSEQLLLSVPVLGVPAQYDAYETSGAPLSVGDSEAGFTVAFTWLGAGTPGSQAFTVYDAATLNVLDTGLTTPVGAPPPPPLPEPSSVALVLLALCGVAAASRHSRCSAAIHDVPKTGASMGAIRAA